MYLLVKWRDNDSPVPLVDVKVEKTNEVGEREIYYAVNQYFIFNWILLFSRIKKLNPISSYPLIL